MEPDGARSSRPDGFSGAIRFTPGDTTPYRRSRMEERRLLLAVALSLLILTAYSMLFPPAPARPKAPSPSAPASSAPAAVAAPAAPAVATAAATEPVARVADEKERRIEVASPQGAIAFTNKGARLLSWQLARFKDKRGHPEEMVQAVAGGARPLDIETGDPRLDARLKEGLFLASAETLEVPAQGTAVLRFEYADAEIQAEKTLSFDATKPLVEFSARVSRQGQPLPLKVLWGPGIGNPTAAEKEVQGYAIPQGVALVGGAVERAPTAKLAEPRKLGVAQWAGMESHYFAALFVPPGGRAPPRCGPWPSRLSKTERPAPKPSSPSSSPPGQVRPSSTSAPRTIKSSPWPGTGCPG